MEKTIKQLLKELSEKPTPFFKSLTPFAAGYTQGYDCEKKRLVGALVNNVEVTKDFIQKPFTIPHENSSLYMHAFLDGASDFRNKIRDVLGEYHNRKLEK